MGCPKKTGTISLIPFMILIRFNARSRIKSEIFGADPDMNPKLGQSYIVRTAAPLIATLHVNVWSAQICAATINAIGRFESFFLTLGLRWKSDRVTIRKELIGSCGVFNNLEILFFQSTWSTLSAILWSVWNWLKSVTWKVADYWGISLLELVKGLTLWLLMWELKVSSLRWALLSPCTCFI